MRRALIQTGLVAALSVAGVSLAHAGHSDIGFTVDLGRTVIHYDDGRRHYHQRPYGYHRYHRHANTHRKQHRRYHRRERRDHAGWHRYNDGRWDPFYYGDHARFHQRRGRDHGDFHRHQRRHRWR